MILVCIVMSKIRLVVKVRGDKGARIESVPLKQLVELAVCHKKRWSYADGWLILEGF